jgi:hypothetical protein
VAKEVAQGVRRRRLVDAGGGDGLLHRPLQQLLVEMMAALDAERGSTETSGGEDILPGPFVLAFGYLRSSASGK